MPPLAMILHGLRRMTRILGATIWVGPERIGRQGSAGRRPARNTRPFNKLKAHRAVAVRYDKRDCVCRFTIDVASIRIWLCDPGT
jgi:hypothetical protein